MKNKGKTINSEGCSEGEARGTSRWIYHLSWVFYIRLLFFLDLKEINHSYPKYEGKVYKFSWKTAGGEWNCRGREFFSSRLSFLSSGVSFFSCILSREWIFFLIHNTLEQLRLNPFSSSYKKEYLPYKAYNIKTMCFGTL